jgi:hypothetical protein
VPYRHVTETVASPVPEGDGGVVRVRTDWEEGFAASAVTSEVGDAMLVLEPAATRICRAIAEPLSDRVVEIAMEHLRRFHWAM